MNSVRDGRFKSVARTFTGAHKTSVNGKAAAPVVGLLLLGMLATSLLSFSTNSALAATSSSSSSSLVGDSSRDAFQLAVTPIAPKLPADGNDYLIMVQLQTAKDGKPREAPYDIDVTLLTSDNTVASPQGKVTIKTG
ncbi:hypothetical protein NTE_00387 [Candidatus Nitrososphaera evergladensis SR1]|uniref:Uncharacterized protein n=1 Tax=Candidatus Nitrososphaera evergladensis SR1 TaxID=1459636 RepID=A0A075MT21_9ARCH|nr:hypothetical protein [Candidatus Nitrososphaera evergladensis]AIF82469.1 hypothetical protein NTE_00387 [Candidatus Nitrososphaera evergladensis SR1]